jgi:hypothetical protein
MSSDFDDDQAALDEAALDEAALDLALADEDAALGTQLRALLDPGGERRARTAADVDRALRSRNTLGATLDLLSVGWWTARTLLTDDRSPADRGPEGR